MPSDNTREAKELCDNPKHREGAVGIVRHYDKAAKLGYLQLCGACVWAFDKGKDAMASQLLQVVEDSRKPPSEVDPIVETAPTEYKARPYIVQLGKGLLSDDEAAEHIRSEHEAMERQRRKER